MSSGYCMGWWAFPSCWQTPLDLENLATRVTSYSTLLIPCPTAKGCHICSELSPYCLNEALPFSSLSAYYGLPLFARPLLSQFSDEEQIKPSAQCFSPGLMSGSPSQGAAQFLRSTHKLQVNYTS